jgi:cytochrome P450
MLAGHLTTTALIGTAVLHLLRNREQWGLLCERPGLISWAPGSRPAAPNATKTSAPSGSSFPASVTGRVVTRRKPWMAVS